MSIVALPGETKHLLGSTSIITTPVSLVKELLENAIDAGASTIEVSISQNTIDRMEVRDDGSGICSEDHDSLGRRGHTSKLRNFDDLPTVAGTTLGFRGEALASANTAGKVTIVTKTSSDPVAAVLHLNRKTGGVLKRERASAPVGTTVKVAELYYEIPVRRQSITKDAAKNLDKIKHLLQSYTMARPNVRLTFKVIGKPVYNWGYSPKRDATVTEAVLQVLGYQLASKCFSTTRRFPTVEQENDEFETNAQPRAPAYVFSAFMWKPDAEFQQSPVNRYCSVDGRPMTSTRGTMKKLVVLYTKYLRKSQSAPCDPKGLKNAFIQVNIECPRGSYDVNIEPAKDQVLFEDEQIVLRHFEALCKDVYVLSERPTLPRCDADSNAIPTSGGSLNTSVQISNTNPLTATQSTRPDDDGSHINPISLSAIRPLVSSQQGTQATGTGHYDGGRINLPQRPPTPFFRPNGTPNDVVDQPPSLVARVSYDNCALGSEPQIYAPVVANNMSDDLSERMENAHGRTNHDRSPMRASNSSLTARKKSSTNISQYHREPVDTHFQAAREMMAFSMTPEPEILRHRGAPPQDLDVPPSMRYPGRPGGETFMSDSVSIDLDQHPARSPDNPVRHLPHIPRRSGGQPPWTPPSSVQKDKDQGQNRYAYSSKTGRKALKQATISFQRSSSSQDSSSVKKRAEGSMRHSHDGTDTNALIADPLNSVRTNRGNVVKHPVSNDGLDNALQNNTASAPNGEQTEKPFTQLQSMAVRIEEEEEKEEPCKRPAVTSLPSGDPRAYLLRRQKSITADASMGRPKKIRRMKSVCLPLETICSIEETREMTLVMKIPTQHLLNSVAVFNPYDKYIHDGEVEEALDMDIGQATQVESRLDLVLSCWSENFGERIMVASHLSSVLKGKGPERSG